MRRFSSLGSFLISSALISAVGRQHGVVIVRGDRERTSTMPDIVAPKALPKALPKKEARSWLKSQTTQADRDAIARAEAKRARKAAKLRGIQS